MSELDLKQIIIELLKEEGLHIAEETAILTVKAVFKIMPKVVQATDNKIDDLLIPILAVVEPSVLKLLDKIDGETEGE